MCKTTLIVQSARAAITRIKEMTLDAPQDVRDSIQNDINRIGSNISNPSLGCLLTLCKVAKRSGFEIGSISRRVYFQPEWQSV